jgi:hypothetical protein
MLLRLVYTSKATFDFTDGDLITLLMNSRANNRRDGLTGILLYSDGVFLQVLEGEEEAVMAKYDRIALDPRHRQIAVILREETDSRQFGRWTMGYTSLTDPLITAIPGYDTFFSDDPVASAEPTRRLLEVFRTNSDLGSVVAGVSA